MHVFLLYSIYVRTPVARHEAVQITVTAVALWFCVSLCTFVYLCLDIARIPVPQNLSGYSLIPLLRGKAENKVSPSEVPSRPPWVLSEFHGCNVNSSTYMLRTGKWKYIAYSDGLSVLPQLFGTLQLLHPDWLISLLKCKLALNWLFLCSRPFWWSRWAKKCCHKISSHCTFLGQNAPLCSKLPRGFVFGPGV